MFVGLDMSKRLTTTQFEALCNQFGKNSFLKRPVDIRPNQNVIKHGQVKEIITWLDQHCISPYYMTKEKRSFTNHTRDLVFYFTDEQDKMVFTLCFCELFT